MCRQLGKKGGAGRGIGHYGPGAPGMIASWISCPTGQEASLSACAATLNYAFDRPTPKPAPDLVTTMVTIPTWNHQYDWGVECTDPAGAGRPLRGAERLHAGVFLWGELAGGHQLRVPARTGARIARACVV